MKRLLFCIFVCLVGISQVQSQWKPAGSRMLTRWGKNIDPSNLLSEYPRPIMKRNVWKNMNGLWEYAITDKNQQTFPNKADGNILVPFPVESSLSGVAKKVGPDKFLWYRYEFEVPEEWDGNDILLHFGAIDWQSDIWLNGVKLGIHKGGYDPFSFKISSIVQKGKNQLVIRVYDPTDAGFQPRGKQVNDPYGILYTSVTGIWQTVWMEPVPKHHIQNVKLTPDVDGNQLLLDIKTNNADSDNCIFEIQVCDGEKTVRSVKTMEEQPIAITMPKDVKLWSPETPFLYTVKVSLIQDGKIVDKIESYAAMRKYSIAKDEKGIIRFMLNNKPIFLYGPLDQGWWPDGLYTAPSDEALCFDIKRTKELGYNMIRKHVKTEPARWYMYCDQLGIIVWQDMPSGDGSNGWQNRQYFRGIEFERTSESESNFRNEWKNIIDYLYSYPCISTWVVFNESWGQFKTQELAEWTKLYDRSRLVNPASGGNHFLCGDILDLHNYPEPEMYLFDSERATVLGEYGAIALVVEDHLWSEKLDWEWDKAFSSKDATQLYVDYANMLLKLVKKGLSAAVYTQLTDVENEVNGLMTYDREVDKFEIDKLRDINEKIINSLAVQN